MGKRRLLQTFETVLINHHTKWFLLRVPFLWPLSLHWKLKKGFLLKVTASVSAGLCHRIPTAFFNHLPLFCNNNFDLFNIVQYFTHFDHLHQQQIAICKKAGTTISASIYAKYMLSDAAGLSRDGALERSWLNNQQKHPLPLHTLPPFPSFLPPWKVLHFTHFFIGREDELYQTYQGRDTLIGQKLARSDLFSRCISLTNSWPMAKSLLTIYTQIIALKSYKQYL